MCVVIILSIGTVNLYGISTTVRCGSSSRNKGNGTTNHTDNWAASRCHNVTSAIVSTMIRNRPIKARYGKDYARRLSIGHESCTPCTDYCPLNELAGLYLFSMVPNV